MGGVDAQGGGTEVVVVSGQDGRGRKSKACFNLSVQAGQSKKKPRWMATHRLRRIEAWQTETVTKVGQIACGRGREMTDGEMESRGRWQGEECVWVMGSGQRWAAVGREECKRIEGHRRRYGWFTSATNGGSSGA